MPVASQGLARAFKLRTVLTFEHCDNDIGAAESAGRTCSTDPAIVLAWSAPKLSEDGMEHWH